MDSRYLASLIRVVDSGSIAEAARLENLTAAAVSQRIQALERDLGLTLLNRTGHAVKASEACLALLPRARQIVRAVALLASDTDTSGLSGPLRIGVISTALTGLLPSALRGVVQAAPQASPVILPGTSRALYSALLNDQLDAAILVAPPFELPATLRSVVIRREALVLLTSEKPKASIQSVLSSQPYIRYDPNAWGGRFAERYLQDNAISTTPLFDLDGLEAIASLVADGMGVSLVPYWAGLESLARNCFTTPVEGRAYDRELVLLTRRDTSRSKMIAMLETVLLAN